MSKVDKVVVQETVYQAFWAGVFSLLMQAVFLIIGKWNYTVLLGNLWGVFVALLNFFLMCLSVQKAVNGDEADAKKVMKSSHSLRSLMVFVMAVVGGVLPWIDTIAELIPLLFPRIAIALRSLRKDSQNIKEVASQNEIE